MGEDTWIAMGTEIAIGATIGVIIYRRQSKLKNQRENYETGIIVSIMHELSRALGDIDAVTLLLCKEPSQTTDHP